MECYRYQATQRRDPALDMLGCKRGRARPWNASTMARRIKVGVAC
jgi:hypothetical protein